MTEPFQNEVTVVTGTQKIIVDAVGKVTVVNAGPVGPPGVGGGFGVTSLSALTDVDVATDPPAVDDFLVWDGTKWTPATVVGDSGGTPGVTSLSALTDVDLTTDPQDTNDVLAWDGTKWTPATLAEAGSGDFAATSHTHTGTQVTVDASGFNGNLTTSDDTVQEVAQKLDDLVIPAAGIADPGGANDDFLQRKSGAWVNRTVAQVKADLTHASSHGDGGTDEISVDASQITTGTVAQARLGTGSAGAGEKFLADDQTYRRAVVGHSQAIGSQFYITGPGRSGISNTLHYLPSVGRQVWHLVWLEAGTYDQIAVITTVAGTSTWRLGLDSATTGLRPGVNVLDAGVVDTSVTPGLLSCTVSFTVTVAGWFFARVKCETFTSAPTAYVVDGVAADTTMFVPGWPTIHMSLPGRQQVALTSLVTTPAGPFGPPPAFTGNGATGVGYSQSGARLYVRKAS